MNAVSEFVAQLAQEIDTLRDQLRAVSAKSSAVAPSDLRADIDRLDSEVKAIRLDPEALSSKFELACTRVERVLHDDAIELARKRASDITEVYHATWTMMSTLEMVIYAVSRSPELRQRISPGEAATKLVRLMGFGADYFHKRNHWTIESWVDHLVHVREHHFPSGGYESKPVAEYTLNK